MSVILKMEVGSVDVTSTYRYDGFTDVSFTNTYTDPAVIVYMSSYNGTDPATVRATDVTASGCVVFIDEVSTGVHETETISYLVIESGDYTLPDGTHIAAGVVAVSGTDYHQDGEDILVTGNYKQITFESSFEQSPAFFTSLNTFNNIGNSTYTCIAAACVDVFTTGAKVFQEISYATNTTPTAESIAWFAIDNAKVSTFLDTTTIETQRYRDNSKDGVTDSPKHVFYHAYPYSTEPINFAQGVTQSGTMGYWTRAYSDNLTYSEVLAEIPFGVTRSQDDVEFAFMAFPEAFSLSVDITPTTGVFFGNNIWTQSPYIYRPTASGLSVFDLSSESLVNFAEVGGGVKSVWADDTTVYAGTTYSGVYTGAVSTVSGSFSLSPYKVFPDVLSNEITYLHGKGNYLCVASSAGVDKYNTTTAFRDSTVVSGVNKCFQTSDGTYYYNINPSIAFIGFESYFLNWKYVKRVSLSSPVPADDYQLLLEIPRNNPHDIVSMSQPNGADIRFMSSAGVVVPHFIESWSKVDNPLVWVKLDKDTQEFFILYGNVAARDTSSGDDTFLLYEHFDGAVLDTDKWEFDDGGYDDNTYEISNSIFKMISTHNTLIPYLNSKIITFGGVMEASVRRTQAAYNSDFDSIFGFKVNNGTYASIGVSATDSIYEHPHWLESQSDWGTVKGSELMSTDFKELTIIESENYQSSQYGDELLVSSGTLTSQGYRKLQFSVGNTNTQPDLEIDWVRLRVYDASPPVPTYYDSEYIQNQFDFVELHAVYEDTANGFVYTPEPGNVLLSNYVNDIFVTENTSVEGGHVIFLGTGWGVMVIEEKRGDETNCRKRVYVVST